MRDLIDRQKAIDALCYVCGNDCDKTEFVYNAPQWEQVIICPEHYALSTLSSAQQEIIRCKDCIHLQKWRSEESAKKFGQIYECVRNVLDCPKPEDFCSHAERRTDE